MSLLFSPTKPENQEPVERKDLIDCVIKWWAPCRPQSAEAFDELSYKAIVTLINIIARLRPGSPEAEQPDEQPQDGVRTARKHGGFTQVPNGLWSRSSLSDGALRLYGYMLSYREGATFSASQQDMGDAMGVTPRQIRNRLAELEKADLIVPIYINIDPKRGHANRYKLVEYVPTKIRK